MSVRGWLRRSANRLLVPLDAEVVRRSQPAAAAEALVERLSLQGSLLRLKELGLAPATVVDVGAALGTPPLIEVFPNCRHLWIEPLEEYRPHLEALARKLPNVELVFAAAGSRDVPVTINVHPDLVGSSLYREEEASDVNGVERSVPCTTLDRLCSERNCPGPFLLKVDVQGAELDVLKGCGQVLSTTETVMLECSLFEFFKGGPQLFEVIAWMKARGFVTYDLAEPRYRPLDGALAQIDVIFVRESGPFHRVHHYATHEQRTRQTLQILESFARSFS